MSRGPSKSSDTSKFTLVHGCAIRYARGHAKFMKAILIGGGIGGLTAAIALYSAGIDAHMFERAPELREVGAGISLWANAIHALEVLGIGDSIRYSVLADAHGAIRTWKGAVLQGAASEKLRKRYGVIVAVLHRADLLTLLTGKINPDHIHLDHECTGFSQDAAGVTAQFKNGKAVRGDLLIGADGLHSVIRARLFRDGPPRYAGYTSWRAVVSFRQQRMVPGESWGLGRRFGVIPMNDGRVYWYATKNAPQGEQDSAGQLKPKLMGLFRGWHDSIEALIEATEESSILRNDIYDREPVSRWTENRVTLLGDAAHPMTPNLGQGACQAIEDAVVLAGCLGTLPRVDSALREYERRRIPRTSRVVMLSRRIGQIASWENPFLSFLRNAAIRATPDAVTEHQIKSVVAYEPLTEREKALLARREPA